ncbi:MAG: nuclear transport factor 2 family protein [Methyloceanibacter sp.]
MDHYTPQHFVCEGESIAMFGVCAYRHKGTGKTAECRIACLWRFRDGKAVEMTEIFDTARAVAAAIA